MNDVVDTTGDKVVCDGIGLKVNKRQPTVASGLERFHWFEIRRLGGTPGSGCKIESLAEPALTYEGWRLLKPT